MAQALVLSIRQVTQHDEVGGRPNTISCELVSTSWQKHTIPVQILVNPGHGTAASVTV